MSGRTCSKWVARYRAEGEPTVERLITDNGAPYRATIHATACKTLGIRHLKTWADTTPSMT